jgi:hypothetical protein
MMQGGQMNPLMMKLVQMMQEPGLQGQGQMPLQGTMPGVPMPGRQGGYYDGGQVQDPSIDMMDQSTIIPQGSDYDMELSEQMGGQPLNHRNQMPYDMEQPMAGGYGPIGNRMERMRPTLVHDRKKVQGMFPKGIPEDVEGATQAMESADDEMGQINAHKKQHKFMKGHLKAGIGRIQAERGGESVDKMFQKLQSDLAKLKEQRAKRGK